MVEINQWGATPADWDLLDLELELTEDLLPVVSNPKAKISPQSKMKALGKTPSRYNKQGNAAGIVKWTEKRSTLKETSAWSTQPDYGICIQTRKVRAFDIDVEDTALAHEITKFIYNLFEDMGYSRPCKRLRGNSSKCLVAFICESDDLFKSVAHVYGGMVEFLATGQQFIAFGTHPSGVRYEWDGAGLEDVPSVSFKDAEAIWHNVCLKFADKVTGSGQARHRGEDLNLEDSVACQLDALSVGPDGQVHIECPFKGEHTTESGESATSYFPAGTGGYEQGHFVCLHAHCAERTDDEFMDALGVSKYELEFEALPAVVDSSGQPYKELPSFERARSGHVLATAENVCAALVDSRVCGWEIAKDVFKEQIVLRTVERGLEGGTPTGSWKLLEDVDYMTVRLALEAFEDFKPIGQQLMREAFAWAASRNMFDSAQEWLSGLQWDGVSRVKGFLTNYIGVEASSYAEGGSLYAWSAMAGRVIRPGAKADMMVIFIGAQGLRKSTAIEALAPTADLFVETSMSEKEDDRVRRTKGRLVGEFGEMRGMHSTALEHTKAYLTRTHDTWIPKFVENSVTYARRIVFWGTSNHAELFTDPTGIRRFLPYKVGVTGVIDLEAIARDRNQLWAEAAVLFKQNGVMWADVESLARDVAEEHMIADPWEDMIADWLARDISGFEGEESTVKSNADREDITTVLVLQNALGLNGISVNSGQGKRVTELMRKLGFELQRVRLTRNQMRVWRKS